MKLHFTLSNILIILLCLSSIVFAQLNGTYTIGSTGDFADFTEAVDSLESQGIDGPVVFNVQDGIYEEQIDIDAITGSSEANQIVFQSLSQDSSQVILKYEAAGDDDNYVVKLSGGSYIIFKQISIRTGKGMYAKGVVLEDFSTHIRFLNCLLKGNWHSDASARYHLISVNVPNVHYLSFEYCLLDSAGTGLQVNTGTQDNPMLGIYVVNSRLTNMGYTSLHLNIAYAPEIRNNYIESGSIGIRLTQMVGPTIIEKNRIIAGQKGVELTMNGYSGDEALLANNFIYSGYSNGMEIRGQYINIYHNSLYANGSGATINGLYVYGTEYLHSINIVNNNICRMRAGRALNVYFGSSIGDCQNNNLYTPGNTFAFWDSVDCDDLAELQLKSEKNENTVSVYPQYNSANDFHTIAPWLDGTGMPLADITDDIDGDSRDAGNPDIGADEFTADPMTTTPLAGSYSVGGATYPTIQDAIDDAVLKGVSAPVTFNIQAGIYNEQLNVYTIPGASSVNRLTLRSESGDTSDVLIEYNSIVDDSNYVIRNYGADFITYEYLTIQATNSTNGTAIDLYQGSDSVVVRGCHLVGTSNANAVIDRALMVSFDSYFRNRIIENNTFENSSYGIYMRRGQWEFEHAKNIKILNNTVLNNGYTAFYLQFYDELTINGNTVNRGAQGIYCISSDNAVKIVNNRINSDMGGTGIFISNCKASTLSRGLIANNFISAHTNSAFSGIQLSNVTHCDVYFNSVRYDGTNREAMALELSTGSNSDLNIINNNFSCMENGYAFSIANADFISEFDYNNFYSPSNFLAKYDGSTYMDIDFVKRYSGTNAHSLSVYPHYVSETDLQTIAPWLDNRGLPLDSVSVDINGDNRDLLHPDIGAIEYTADPALTTPLHGAITIGSGGDYSTIQGAFDDALLKGVSGPVDFQVMPGIHNEQIDIVSIPGTSPLNMVTLQSQSGDTSDTEIMYTASSQDDNFVVRFYGADFINLENLKITANGSTYAKVIDFYLGADSIALRNNSFSSVFSPSSSTDRAIISSPDAYYFSRIIENNVFHACSYGIYMRAAQNNVPYPLGAVIKNNQFKNCGYVGMYIQFYDALQIIGNEIISNTYGIEAITCINELKILNNKISAGSQYGLYVGSSDAGEDHHGLIANNFVTVGGVGTAYGLNITSSSYQDIVHNSLNITSTHATNGRALYINSGNNLFFKNNILANNGGGYAYYNSTPAAVAESDYNDIYTTGTNLAYWNGVRTDLATLQTESTMDSNSLSIDPDYTSDTDLHIASETLDGAGTPIAEVDFDIDYQNRHPLHPDIGADEYRTGPNTAPYVSSAIPDQVIDEDTSPHTIAALQVVFTDDDLDDYLTFEVIDYPGIVATKANDTLVINLDTNYNGIGTVYVIATDLGGLTASDTFLVTVNSVPDAPVAVDDEINTLTNTMVEINPLDNDTDVDSDVLTIFEASDPPHGMSTILAGDTVITYTPDLNYFGLDTIRYIVQDESALKDTAFIYVEVLNLFSEYDVSLPGVSNGTSIWVDIDLDNILDLFIMGDIDNSNNSITRIYKNGATPFSTYINLPGQSPDNPQGAAFGDFNNDGYPDLIMTGKTSGDPFTVSTRIYKNMNGISFQEMTTSVIDIWGGSVSWIDYDLDGDQDLLVSGSSTSELYDEVTKLYRNDGADGTTGWTFTEVSMPAIPQLSRTTVCWFDFDMDKDPDLLISGMTPTFYTKLLQNDNGEFSEVDVELIAIADAQWRWHDFDADGDPDLFFSGYTGGMFESAAGIYRNDGSNGTGGWNFTLLDTDFESVSYASADWLDFDNDGDSDIFLSGRDETTARSTNLYVNNEGTYETGAAVLPAVSNGGCAWGDFDNDGRVDVVLTGSDAEGVRRTIIMQNNTPVANTPPLVPRFRGTGLNLGSMTFIWSSGGDAQTPDKTLTYNISLGVSEDGVETVSPLSDLETGFHHIVASGNVYGDTAWTITGVTAGKLYYLRIQAIDAAYGVSEFTMVTRISSTSRYFHEVATDIPGLMNADADFADYDRDGDQDLLVVGRDNDFEYYSQVHSYNPTYRTMQSANLDIDPAYKPSLDWRDFNSDLDMDLLLSGFDPNSGLALYFTRIYDYQSGTFNQLDTALPGSWEGDSKFIDFDNDGDLDVMVMGHTSTLPFTYLYINDDGAFYDSGMDFTGLYLGGQAWCDYDQDGDPDVILTGIGQINHANTILYRNDGDTFTEVDVDLMQVCKGNPAWGDMDMDGDDDLLLTGEFFDGENWTPTAKIYENTDGDLSEYETLSVGVKDGRAAWGDIDNDGALDIIMTGYKPMETPGYSDPVSMIYLNDDGEFTIADIYLGNLGNGILSLGDINGDYNLDIFLCGSNEEGEYESKVFRNSRLPVNTVPQAPSGLHAEQNDSVIVFTWNAGSDEQTTASGLTYNIRVGTLSGGNDLVNPQSDTTGYRLITEAGNAGHLLTYSLKLRSIPRAIYWSVQSVDNSWSGSAFATEQSLIIDAIEDKDLVVTDFALYQNYPNPFNPSTKIKFDVPVASDIKIVLYNILGEKVRTLLNKKYAPGRYEYVMNASGLAAGLYFYRIKTDKYTNTRRMILIK